MDIQDVLPREVGSEVQVANNKTNNFEIGERVTIFDKGFLFGIIPLYYVENSVGVQQAVSADDIVDVL